MLGREGVISSVETQDWNSSMWEFHAWAGITVIIYTRLIAKQQRREALIELTDGPCLKGRVKRADAGGETQLNWFQSEPLSLMCHTFRT